MKLFLKNAPVMMLILFLGLKSYGNGPNIINTFPYFENFESEPLCGTSCSNTCNLMGGWKNALQYGFPAAGTNWLAEDGATPSSPTGPDFDHTTGTGKYLYVESSGCNNISADLYSDVFDFTNVSNPAMEYWYHMFGATMGTLQIDVLTNGGTTVTNVIPPFTQNINLWQVDIIDLSAFAGNADVRIRIRAITGPSFTSDIAIDDIKIFDCSVPEFAVNDVQIGNNSCFLTNSETIEVTIQNTGCLPIPSGTEFEITFTANGVNPVTENFTLSSTLSGNATAIFESTSNFDLSGNGDQLIEVSMFITSYPAIVLTGSKTLFSGIAGLPYLQDFESGAGGWKVVNYGAAPASFALGTPVKPIINSAHSGTNAYVTNLTNNYSDNEHCGVESPCFDLRNLLDANFSMHVWWNCEFSWDGAVLQSSIDNKQTWQNIGAFGDPNNWYTDNTIVGNPGGQQEGWSGRVTTSNGSGGWVQVNHDINHLVGISPVYFRIAFATDGSVVDDGFAFDDINITGTTNCNPLVRSTKQDGDYDDVNTWVDDCAPFQNINSTMTVNINHNVTVPSTYTITNNGTINATSTFTNEGSYKGSGVFIGNFINNGSVKPGAN